MESHICQNRADMGHPSFVKIEISPLATIGFLEVCAVSSPQGFTALALDDFGTLKKTPSVSGAPARTRSRLKEGPISSGRKRRAAS